MGPTKVRYQVIEKDGQEIVQEIHKVIVHRFRLADVEDPDLYAAQPLYDWEKSEPGQFIMKYAIDQPEWHRHINHQNFGYDYVIVAELEKKKLSEFYLKFDKIKI